MYSQATFPPGIFTNIIYHEMNKTLVSIIIPTYKRAIMLHRAVASALEQTYRNIEVLVVSDNEPDDEFTVKARETVELFNDSRVRLITQEKHINGAVARNVAIRQAKGEYIAFLDDDDWWEFNKIEEQVKVLSQLDDSWGGVSCKFRFFNRDGQVIGKTRKYRDGYIYRDILYLQSDVATSTLLLRKKALDDAGYFDENLLRNQDLQLLVYFTYKYKLKEVDQYLHCVDVSDAQNRANGDKAIEVKKKFYTSVKPILDTLTPSEYRCMDAMRNVEIAFLYLKEGKYVNGLNFLCKVLKSPKAIGLTFKKIYDRFLIKYGR